MGVELETTQAERSVAVEAIEAGVPGPTGPTQQKDITLGTVKWFSRLKGWGFIEPDGGDRDVFVHFEDIVGEGFRNLEQGERVAFRVEHTPKGPKAAEAVTTT
jgi:CspA family cold shock protein